MNNFDVCEASSFTTQHNISRTETKYHIKGIQINRISQYSSKHNGLTPMDSYYVISTGALCDLSNDDLINVSDTILEIIREICHPILKFNNRISVLTVGLGNRLLAPDALGPETVERIDTESNTVYRNKHRSLALIPGTRHQTGIDTATIIRGVADKAKPDVIFAIDAYTTRSLTRAGKMIQIGNCGIIPGSGAGEAHEEISYTTLGIPVISIGIPTAINFDSSSLPLSEDTVFKTKGSMLLTLSNTDIIVNKAAMLLSYSINNFISDCFPL